GLRFFSCSLARMKRSISLLIQVEFTAGTAGRAGAWKDQKRRCSGVTRDVGETGVVFGQGAPSRIHCSTSAMASLSSGPPGGIWILPVYFRAERSRLDSGWKG